MINREPMSYRQSICLLLLCHAWIAAPLAARPSRSLAGEASPSRTAAWMFPLHQAAPEPLLGSVPAEAASRYLVESETGPWVREALLLLGWLAAGSLILFGLLFVNLAWNFCGWTGPCSKGAPWLGAAGGGVILCFCMAAMAGPPSCRILSALMCLFLLALGLAILLPDHDPVWKPTPRWFRTMNCLILCLPALAWLSSAVLTD